MIDYKLTNLDGSVVDYSGLENENLSFIIKEQLKKPELWEKFVNVYLTKEDSDGMGWRGEYFGKMMRGACLAYNYSKDEELYEILNNAVEKLLIYQEKSGRISTYTPQTEFSGWDMWCRKYVTVGLLYFYGICKSESDKKRILSAMIRHIDYIISKVGEGKIDITQTSYIYGGLNSCTILEPIVELYKLTGYERYLRFAEYIISTGGASSGSLIVALKKGKYPYEFPEVKAYEMMSFFEGLLAYYEINGKEEYLELVKTFMERVKESDVTVIGSCGCTHELFDNSLVKQTEEVEDGAIMQETCVTVTYMRLNERLLRLTGDAEYAEEIEKSAYNALYGSLNYNGYKQYCREENGFIDGLPFDSYSPLTNQKRGIGIGGYKKFYDGGYYGCCGCIGAAGVALFPLIAVQRTQNGYLINEYFVGKISDKKLSFTISGNGVINGKSKITIDDSECSEVEILLRIPRWSVNPVVKLNGKAIEVNVGYNRLNRVWRKGDVVEIQLNPRLSEVKINDKTAYIYGGLTLARDQLKEGVCAMQPFTAVRQDGKFVYQILEPKIGESVRLLLKTTDGNVLLTDYASCGKNWLEENSRISVWLNVE